MTKHSLQLALEERISEDLKLCYLNLLNTATLKPHPCKTFITFVTLLSQGRKWQQWKEPKK